VEPPEYQEDADGTGGDSGILLASRAVTHGVVAEERLSRLCSGLVPTHQHDMCIEVLRCLSDPWSSWPMGDVPAWTTDICDDGTPFEFSFAFERPGPSVRILVESQQAPVGPLSSWNAGLRLNEKLATWPGVDLRSFRAVRDLFAPTGRLPIRFSIWHAAGVSPDADVSFKVYLNPQVHGPDRAASLVQAALQRLGLKGAAEFIEERVRGRTNVVPLYFSLDLSSRPGARAKVYLGHEGARAKDLEPVLGGCRDYVRGDAERWITGLTGTDGPFARRPLLTCFSFSSGAAAPQATVHVPVRCYTSSDAATMDRALGFLDPIDGELLKSALCRMAPRPLDAGRGLVSYVSFRHDAEGLRVTTYFAPEAYAMVLPEPSQSVLLPEIPPSGPSATHATSSLGDLEREIQILASRLAEHPFLQRLEGFGTLDDIRVAAYRLTFFVMCFQDVLRLVSEKMSDEGLASIARTHELEDKGHDHWFLHDLRRFGVAVDVESLFGPHHQDARDISYELTAEVLRAQSDWSRLAVVLSLEAMGSEFFGRIVGFLQRIDSGDGLKYFARGHVTVEQAHDLLRSDKRAPFLAASLSPRDRTAAIETALRVFGAMTRFADSLNDAMARRRTARPAP
jgi:DMATS type aromatic prenyltransferase